MNQSCSRVWTWHEEHTRQPQSGPCICLALSLSHCTPFYVFKTLPLFSLFFTCELRFPASSASRIYQKGSCSLKQNKKLWVLNKTRLWTKMENLFLFFNRSGWWYQLINIKFSASARMWKLKWLPVNVCAELMLFVSNGIKYLIM